MLFKDLARGLGLVACGSVAGLMASNAVAANLPVKAPPVPYVSSSWTGFYLGGNIGWGWEHHTITNTGTINSGNFPAGTTSSGDISGILGGVQIGYDWQFNPKWLVGVAADFDWTGIEGGANNASTVNPAIVTHPHDDYPWLATATGRLGYVADNWLLYVKGGAAWAKSKTNSYTTNGAGATTTIIEGSTTRTGWTLGAGTEWRFAQHWSALIEYDYLDFGTTTLSEAVTFGTAAPVLTGATVLRDSRAYINLVKAGINYRF